MTNFKEDPVQLILLVVSLVLIAVVVTQTCREQRSTLSKICRGAAGVVLFSTLNLIPLAADQTLSGPVVIGLYLVAAAVAVVLLLAGRSMANRG